MTACRSHNTQECKRGSQQTRKMLRSRERRCNPAATGKASTRPTCAARHCFSVLRSWCRPPSGFNVGGQWGSSSTRLLVARGWCNSYPRHSQYRDRSEGHKQPRNAVAWSTINHRRGTWAIAGEPISCTIEMGIRHRCLLRPTQSEREGAWQLFFPHRCRGTTRTCLSITHYNSSRARLFLKGTVGRDPDAVLIK